MKGESINKYRKNLSKREARILSDLSYRGNGIFTIEDIRDYYDVWRLVTENKVDIETAKELFGMKCKAKVIEFTGVDQFFPDGIVATLEPYLEVGLTRLSSEPLPTLDEMIEEIRKNLGKIF